MSSSPSPQAALAARIGDVVRIARGADALAPSITNTVTVEFVANAQLAVGGSAAMVYLPDEGETMAAVGGAVYLNMGTLFPIYAETLPRTVRALQAHGTPWVLDPVAIGIGALRTELLAAFKEFRPTVIRGNASEVIALAALWGLAAQTGQGGRGVDAVDGVDTAREAAVALSRWTGGAVAVSGETDLVTDGRTVVRLSGGSPLMTRVTGSGCSLGGVAAVYAASVPAFDAALAATAIFNVAGERAGAQADTPASFRTAFLDELYRLSPDEVAAVKMSCEECGA